MAERALPVITPEAKRENPASHARKTEHSPSISTPIDRILFLQRTIGNRAVNRLIKSGALQTRLRISLHGDIYEQEAERVAEQVMRMPETNVKQPQKGDEKSQAKENFGFTPENATKPELHQDENSFGHDLNKVRKHINAPEMDWEHIPHEGAVPSPDILRTYPLSSLPADGEPLRPDVLRTEEVRVGVTLSGVRLHQNKQAERASEACHARAFTVGDHIFTASGVPPLQSHGGRDTLSHELTHVAQNKLDPTLAGLILRLPETDVVTQLIARLNTNDKPGFFQVLRAEAGAHASSTAVRTTLSGFLAAGRISQAEAWRAVCLQVLGDETQWQLSMRNFIEGVESGQFTPPAGMPPNSRDALLETAVMTAHMAAAGSGTFAQYQALFNSRWETSPLTGLLGDFDPTLDSKGPRTQRSRAIFNQIYSSNTTIKAAYDANTGGIRDLIDQYVGPESLNIIASPRLQSLRALFRTRSLITSNNLNNPSYVVFKNLITSVAQSLDINDLTEIERSHEWRLIIDRTVSGERLRADLTQFLATAWMSAPLAAPATAPSTTTAPSAPAATTAPLTLTTDQQAFVSGLSLQGPASPIASNNPEEQLNFIPRSVMDPAGLTIQSRVEVTPAGLIRHGQQTQNPWPPSAAVGNAHTAIARVEGGTTGFTDFTGTLSLVHAGGTVPHTPPQSVARIQDQRQTWFIANIQHGLIFSDQNIEYLWMPGDSIQYYGGQQPLSVEPYLPSSNRELTIFVRARLSKNGLSFHNFQLIEFGRTSERRHLGGVTVLETVPPATTPTNMDLLVEFFASSNTTVPAFHSIPVTFQILPGAAFTNAQLLAQAQADHAQLNLTTPGSILDDMTNMGGQAARISQAIQGGAILLEPTIVRPDSAAFLRSHPALGNPKDHVAYLVGHTVVNNYHTLVGGPGADAWQWGRFPTSIFINLTPSLANLGNKRQNSDIIPTIIHESVHAVDIRLGSSSLIEQYKTEFRAYWMSGDFNAMSTAFDPTMNNFGPRSERSRAIFNHLYGSPTYRDIRRHYDKNIAHFRERVNAFIVPDGINLIVSLRLDSLRAAIEAFTGSGFTAHRAAIQALYALCDATDRQEISGSRYWRALVERKYSSSQENLIKGDLNIPI
ncbi:hypothetical protein ig2599ANME_1253 [groundwater metagenome]